MINLGELIFKDLEKNDYLHELYSKLLNAYSSSIVNGAYSITEKELSDSLRFADLLSKSTNANMQDYHHQLAQEIVILCRELFPQFEIVDQFLGSILSNNGNFPGIINNIPDYTNSDDLDRIYELYDKQEYKVPGEDNTFFSKSQKRIYDHFEDESFSYSGPTSMGKSFLIKYFIKRKITDKTNCNFVFLVPTNALINEVSNDLYDELKPILIPNKYRVITITESILLDLEDNHFILVLTPERLLYLLMSHPDFKVDYVFIDEAHKLISQDGRSTFYYKVVDYLMRRQNSIKPKVIFSSPNIPNPDLFQKTITNPQISKTIASIKLSPVNQFKFIVDFDKCKLKVHSSIENKVIDCCDISPTLDLNELIQMRSNIFSPNLDERKNTLVYCSSVSKAIKLAKAFADTIPMPSIVPDELQKFSDELKEDISEHYFLVELVKKGVAFHVGYLPNKTRIKLEKLFKARHITVLFCTSTLIEGVNFPAKNLFVTNYKNGRNNLSNIDFKNLIGRVGRIQFNLYGTIYLINFKDNRTSLVDKYEDLLTADIKSQKLSIEDGITSTEKKLIVETLIKGETSFEKKEGQNDDQYNLMKKTTNILLYDILHNNNSLVVKEFEQYLGDNKEVIKEKFTEKSKHIDDDINVSCDQIVSLRDMIISGELRYPEFIPNDPDRYSKIVPFLEKLCKAFKWDILEKGLVGNMNANGNHNLFNYYATMLNKWISGKGINYIASTSIDYYDSRIGNIKVKVDGWKLEDYDGSPLHKNIVIANTLDTIENVILFNINNYCLKFSREYKTIYPDDEDFIDWQKFIEYGSTDSINIFLQQVGLYRETALFIRKNNYLEIKTRENGKKSIRIKDEIFECKNQSVIDECKYLKINVPELFEDD